MSGNVARNDEIAGVWVYIIHTSTGAIIDAFLSRRSAEIERKAWKERNSALHVDLVIDERLAKP